MKKIIIIVVIILLVIFAATTYLNKILIPQKLKSLVVDTLAQQTGKSVSLRSLEFSIFSGLVLRDLVISDAENVIISTRQASCTVFIWPIFKKQIIIPGIKLKTPYIFLQRKSDGSFNLQEFLLLAKKPAAKKTDFSVAVFKLTISNGNITFQDDSLAVPFKKEIKNIQLSLQLGLPVKLKFNLSAELPSQIPASISASGEYKIIGRQLAANLFLKNISLQEFSAYYGNLGSLFSGLADLQAQVSLKDQLLTVDLSGQAGNLAFTKDSLRAKFNFNLQSKINYNLADKKLEFSGISDIRQADISGLEFLGQVKNLSGRFIFNQRSLVADDLKAELWGLPLKIKLGIKDLSTMVLNVSTDCDLSVLPSIAKEKFDFSLISSASGRAALAVKIHPDNRGDWTVRGDLNIAGAALKLDKVNDPVEEITAVLAFGQQGLNWIDTEFKYQGINYETSGSLYDFSAPQVKLKLFAPDLSLAGDFKFLDKQVKITQLSGKYLNTGFSVSGEIDREDANRPLLDLSGKIGLELGDLNKILGKTYPVIKTISPAGPLDIEFILRAPNMDFKNCSLQVKSISDSFTLYGLKVTNFSLDYLQEGAIAKVLGAHAGFYDGIIQGSGAVNLNTPDLVYQAQIGASAVNLEKLKNDTVSRQKNIAGIFLGEAKINGAGNDLGKLDAAGSFAVSRGRLGELNLLQGLGKLLLAKDLGNIEFTEADCKFLAQNKYIFTDALKISSHIVKLDGPVKIGFDSSIDGALNVEIVPQMASLDGTFKDVTTAIISKGGRFGVIRITGSLQEPKYSFRTAVGNIIQGLTNMLLKK